VTAALQQPGAQAPSAEGGLPLPQDRMVKADVDRLEALYRGIDRWYGCDSGHILTVVANSPHRGHKQGRRLDQRLARNLVPFAEALRRLSKTKRSALLVTTHQQLGKARGVTPEADGSMRFSACHTSQERYLDLFEAAGLLRWGSYTRNAPLRGYDGIWILLLTPKLAPLASGARGCSSVGSNGSLPATWATATVVRHREPRRLLDWRRVKRNRRLKDAPPHFEIRWTEEPYQHAAARIRAAALRGALWPGALSHAEDVGNRLAVRSVSPSGSTERTMDPLLGPFVRAHEGPSLATRSAQPDPSPGGAEQPATGESQRLELSRRLAARMLGRDDPAGAEPPIRSARPPDSPHGELRGILAGSGAGRDQALAAWDARFAQRMAQAEAAAAAAAEREARFVPVRDAILARLARRINPSYSELSEAFWACQPRDQLGELDRREAKAETRVPLERKARQFDLYARRLAVEDPATLGERAEHVARALRYPTAMTFATAVYQGMSYAVSPAALLKPLSKRARALRRLWRELHADELERRAAARQRKRIRELADAIEAGLYIERRLPPEQRRPLPEHRSQWELWQRQDWARVDREHELAHYEAELRRLLNSTAGDDPPEGTGR
jgi:hypothetical protein